MVSVLSSTKFTYTSTGSGLAASSGGTAGADVTSCIQSALDSDLTYIGSNYFGAPAVLYPLLSGDDFSRPVVGFFICRSCFNANWNTIWSTVGPQNYPYSQEFFEEFGKFGNSAGEYGWPQPMAWSSTNQYTWDFSSYLTNLYSQGHSAYESSGEGTIGVFYKGFDDNNASWSGNRVIAQQCGQVLLNTANFLNMDYAQYMQVATWNDYEEATEIESGVDNCYTVTSSISGTQLSWTLNKTNSYATPSTINSFTVWYADSENNLFPAKNNISSSSSSLSLAGLIPPGTWTNICRNGWQAVNH